MTKSIWPIRFRYVNSQTPPDEPSMPPASSTSPMRRSTLPRRHWTCSDEIELATTWLAWLATATAGGMPTKIRRGVARNPPPTPNMPDRSPAAAPRPSRTNTFIESSAMGR